MPSAHLTLREEDVVRLCLEFLHNRDLHISQLSVERETGVINGAFSDDMLFLRQLVLDGQWDDVLEFIQPLEAIPAFDMKKFRFLVLQHKYVELLCIKTEASLNGNSVDSAVEEVVKVLNELERVAPTKEEYSKYCLLLTLPRLSDHLHYKDWNPSNARVKCFHDVFPLVEKFLPGDKKSERNTVTSASAKNDRLVQLIIKGILYESCVSYCQAKATGSKESQTHEMNFSRLLDGSVGFSDSDLSLLSWLQSIPHDTFSVPFEQRTLNVDVERLERPSLETSWTEHMLVTPIKPKTFPHSAMPFTRPRSAADIMSRSLLPALEGSSSVNRANKAALMALSTGDILTDSPMSRSSFASFHLTGHKSNKLMNTSVDRLFDNDGDVFLSSSYTEFQLPSISEQHSTPVDKRAAAAPSNASTPEHRSSASTSTTARSSRRDSLSDKPVSSCTTLAVGAADSFDGDLLKEYQRHKQRFHDTLVKEDMTNHVDNRLQDSSDRYVTTICGTLHAKLTLRYYTVRVCIQTVHTH